MAAKVYLSLGTNLGNRLINLANAVKSMNEFGQVTASSNIYETPPWGFIDQPFFYNQVVAITTPLAPAALLTTIKKKEEDLGRQPNFRYGPRLIDIDILFYDDLVMESANLTIPHPRLSERAFVLVPLVDLVPDLIHPLSGLTCREMLAAVDVSGVKMVDNLSSTGQ